MENKIKAFSSPSELVEENPLNNGRQAPIYLLLDWEEETVDVDTYYEKNSVPMDIFHGLRTRIKLPDDIDATHLFQDVEDLMPAINEIYAGYVSEWDGNNWRGTFTDSARDKLAELEYQIENNPATIFYRMDQPCGLMDAGDWFQDRPAGLTADTTDEECEELASSEFDDVNSDGLIVIRGGYKKVVQHFFMLRDGLADD